MKTPYRILKLRSGEQIIAKLRGEERGKIVIERPMIFMTRVMMDPYSGREKELTVLKNWLSGTNEIQTSIPKDYIATYLIPDNSIMELYSVEKERQDVDPRNPKLTNLTEMIRSDLDKEPTEQKTLENMLPEEIMEMIDMMKDAVLENPELLNDMEDEEDTDTLPPKSKSFITMSMMLPPEALLSLVEAGLLDEDDVLSLIENINGKAKRIKYNGDDKERQKEDDFGNEWTDWSPDLKDYL